MEYRKKMSFLILFIGLSTGFLLAPCMSGAVDFLQADKKKHFAASFAISAGTYVIARYYYERTWWESAFYGLGMSLTVGALAEAIDETWDPEDMQANALGATSGLIIPLAFEF